jgi:hypothetical protein
MAELCGALLRGKNPDGKQREGTCRRPAGWGTEHAGVGKCKLHFGTTVNSNNKAAAVLFTRGVQEAIGKLNIIPVDDPLTELSKLAGEVVAWKDVIAGKVSFLEDVRYDGEKTGEQIRGEVIVFERALDRCNTVLATMAKLNIDERLARVSEMQAQIVADAVSAVLGEMGLNGTQQREAKTRVAEKLRLVAG